MKNPDTPAAEESEEVEHLHRLFEQAQGLPAEERATFLEEACAGDADARAEIESLLAAADDAEPFFDKLGQAVISAPSWPEERVSDDSSDYEAFTGRSVGHYAIEEKLGAGGMGVVYRAHDSQLDRTVALKFLSPHLIADEVATERFLVEARAAAALDHPNVCTVHEIGRDEDGRPFIAMAYYEGDTLKERLNRGALPYGEAAAYAAQIAGALAAAHAGGIVHRDVKPGNVIVTQTGAAKVLDFGLAKLADVTLTRTGSTIGTVAYMSPEHTRGDELDARTDLWSLGVVLYEMLTGRRPFRGDRQGTVIHAIRNDEPERLGDLIEELPPDLDEIVSKLLQKDPGDRYESADALLTDLLPLAPEGLHVERATPGRLPWGAAKPSFWSQLKRRKVYHTAALYAVAAWVLVQVAVTTLPYLGFSEGAITLVIVMAAVGFPIALGLAWAFEISREGIHRTRLIDIATDRPRPVQPVPVRVARGVAGVLAIAAIVGGTVAGVLTVFPGLPRGTEAALDPNLIAVAVLENQTGQVDLDPLGRQAAARIAEAVHQHGVADVVSTEVAQTVADEREGLEDPEGIVALARASGASVIIHGAYYLVGDSLQFQLEITDVAEGEVMSALRPVRAPKERTDDALSLVQERTLGALAAALDFRDGDLVFPTEPPSIEAYRLFWQGGDARLRGEMEEALENFEQAWAMDSTWISPLLYTSLTLINLNRPAEADSLLQVAAGRRQHMSEPEHLTFQILHSDFDVEDPTVKLRSVRRLAELAPGVGLRWGYMVAQQAHRPQEALEFLARVDTASPGFKRAGSEYWRYTAFVHHALGQFEEQLEVAREGRRRFPDHMHLLDNQLRALAALGRTAEIEALLDTVLALPGTELGSGNVVVPHLRVLFTGTELRVQGHPDAARRTFQRGLDWIEARPPEWMRQHPSWYWLSKAAFLYELGRWEEARDLYERLAEEPEHWDPPLLEEPDILASLAGAAARLGDVERARAITLELAERFEGSPRASKVLLSRARIAAVLGERDEAVQLLRDGFRMANYKGPYVEIVHRTRDFESLHDYLPYQQFLKPRG